MKYKSKLFGHSKKTMKTNADMLEAAKEKITHLEEERKEHIDFVADLFEQKSLVNDELAKTRNKLELTIVAFGTTLICFVILFFLK